MTNINKTIQNKIGFITLQNESNKNALGTKELLLLIDILNKYSKDKSVNMIVIQSSISGYFSSGSDCCELQHLSGAEAKIFASTGQRLIRTIKELKKLVIVAIDGKALGAGFEITLAADVIFATTKSDFGFPEINRGIIPGFGGTQLAARKTYETFVKYLVFTGDSVSADELYSKGIISKIFDNVDEMSEHVDIFAEKISSKSLFALGLAKETINAGIEVDLNKALLIEQNAFTVAFSSQDKIEGMTAFVEKRKPQFKDRWEDFEDL